MIQNLKDGVAAQDYDVVSFFDGTPKVGDVKYSIELNGAKFLFSSEQNKDTFNTSPEKYIPQYGGFCAIAMSEGKQLSPNPKSWEVRDGKLFFFTRIFFGLLDAKRQWVKAPEAKKSLADAAGKN